LEQATEKKKQKPQKIFALILINLDRFKNINDNMGHKVGDELLRRVAKRLEACVYSNDLVSRIGGDEFAILLDDLPTNAEAKSVIERVNQEFSRSFFIDDNDIYVSLSMGLAFINDLKLKSTEILRNADLALRSARKNDDGYKIFNGRMLKDYKTKANLEADLQVALNENQLFLVYQPMFDLIRRRVAGFEALIRWNHPTQGLISPADFIPIAEESGLIIEIDYWVLKNAAKQLKSWNLRFNKTKNMFVSINLSARNVVLETSASDISACIRKQGIDPENIKLEVTEGVLMNNMRVASSVLSELRSEGFRIQLDDFGTGYSSLSYIQKLPIDSLKIDQSFIRRMDGGKQDEAIVKAILALGAGLNLEVVAEGVETPYQLERLTEMNCDYAQGYLIARPLVTEEVEKRFFIKK
ncbi:MAG TPA: bifunctional diguanylate cyclase/phosphodiesterase, partial [Trueperaceae bacterium]|nr:bifunctional diguanylate cyclase/phosphodiesterase [Trueperaceae bacterium]